MREYERCLGLDGVPLDGGWPLGISPTIAKEYQAASSVDDFEERRQQELRERWVHVMNKHGVAVENNTDANDLEKDPSATVVVSPPSPTEHLETRQYDYRKRINEVTQSTKNPLFGPLKEEDRMLLLNDSSSSLNDKNDDSSATSTSSSIPNSPRRNRNRARSNSMHSVNDNTNISTSTNKRHHMTTRRARANSEQLYSEHFTSTDVMHIQHELEQVRINRTLEGSTGCTCRKLDVYLPPPDGGGKKAQHRRMKPQKVIEELRKRGKLPSNSQEMSRSELEQLLHNIVEEEPCCWGEDCSCRKDGIGCQADACSCWFESHQRKGHNHGAQDDDPSVKCIRERCGNNMYAVDLDGIHHFRLQYCQVIESGKSS